MKENIKNEILGVLFLGMACKIFVDCMPRDWRSK